MTNNNVVQFELWENCGNNCSFCYYGKKQLSTARQKLRHLETLIDFIKSPTMKKYDGIALLGGEIFDPHIIDDDCVMRALLHIIVEIKSLVDSGQIKSVWLLSNLLFENKDVLDYALAMLMPINEKHFVMLGTSYDTMGRFSSDKQEKLWWNNLTYFHNKFFNIQMHTQIITSDDFIKKYLKDSLFIKEMQKLSWVDFKTPSITMDNLSAYGNLDTYVETMLGVSEKMPDFFIKSRAEYLQFLQKVKDEFGEDKLRMFASNQARSPKFVNLTRGFTVEDRWNPKYSLTNAPCGHTYDSYIYLDDPYKCSHCDALGLL